MPPASPTSSLWGSVQPSGIPGVGGNPAATFGSMIGIGIQFILTIAAVLVLLYLLWGAFDWILAAGEKGKIEKAQQKITHAIIGIIVLVGSLTLWTILTTQVLHIVTLTPEGGWTFTLPHF